MRTPQTSVLSRTGPMMAVAALHLGIICAISVSLGIVPIPSIPRSLVVIDVKEPRPLPDPVKPIEEPKFAQRSIDFTLKIPPVEVPSDTTSEVKASVIEEPEIEKVPDATGDAIPRPLHATSRVDPLYPPAEQRLSHEGTVQLQVHVDERGHVLEVKVARSSGFPRLDASAMEAVRRWQFSPATDGLRATSGWGTVAVTFKLT